MRALLEVDCIAVRPWLADAVFGLNCASVRRGDVATYGDITKALDAFTQSYRAQGGTAPDPPWEW